MTKRGAVLSILAAALAAAVLAPAPSSGGQTPAEALMEAKARAAETPRPPDELEALFASPPDEARPWVYWFWLGGNITREGITRDLEALRRAGISGVLLMNGSLGEGVHVASPVPYGTPGWRAMVVHAARECRRLGLQMVFADCDGWCESGGPWIEPAEAMKGLVSAELRLRGPALFRGGLPKPGIPGPLFDAAVVAYPTPPDAAALPRPALRSSLGPGVALDALVDGNLETGVKIPVPAPPSTPSGAPAGPAPAPAGPGAAEQPSGPWIRLDYPEPVAACALRIAAAAPREDYQERFESWAVLEASDDGRAFTPVVRVPPVMWSLSSFWLWGTKTAAFPLRRAASWRVVFDRRTPDGCEVREVELRSEGRVHLAETKSALFADFDPPSAEGPELAATRVVDPAAVVDLTGRVGPDGTLDWEVPAGDWTILRLCAAPNGAVVRAASAAGAGLEADKMDPAAMAEQFREADEPLLRDLGDLAGTTVVGLEMDSWETGSSNWTPGFLREFRRRRGYFATPFLPALDGRVVGSADASDRFLFDVRKTVAELVADVTFSGTRSLLAPYGAGLWGEALGPMIHEQQVADALQCKGRLDVPMAEFWVHPAVSEVLDVKEASSAAHVYGKPINAAESFTGFAAPWTDSPGSVKALGDRHLALGVNRLVVHRTVLQPGPGAGRAPGIVLGPHGLHFDRTNTWFEWARPWTTYLARCQALLRRGLPVADVALYLGEDPPIRLHPERLRPAPPAGYDYDALSDDALLSRFEAGSGGMALPDGMSYRLLVLPETDRMTPEVARKVRDLAAGGAAVLGPRPARSPSFRDYPNADIEVQRIADELWGPRAAPGPRGAAPGPAAGRRPNAKAAVPAGDPMAAAGGRRFGKGFVFSGISPAAALAALGVPPDVVIRPAGRGTPDLRWIHRRDGGTDIYFVANVADAPAKAEITFRVSGRRPELWDAVTGDRRPASDYRLLGGAVAVRLSLPPAGSTFVVFRTPKAGEIAGGDRRSLRDAVAFFTVPGPWSVRFDRKAGGPGRVEFPELADWSRDERPGIRFYSGKATYHAEFTVPPEALPVVGPLALDLGRVRDIAAVRLNGRDLGVVWTAPWRVNVDGILKPGRNRLEVDVIDVWRNRLIGDAGLPPEKRLTWTTFEYYKPGDRLGEAGLLGPVTLVWDGE